MGRWKPPRKAGSPYITAAGYAALQEEQKALCIRRREVVAALAAASAEGDRSEKAEYIYRKKELGGIDRRIRYLQKRMPVLKIVRHEVQPERVFFGATVELEFDDKDRVRYQLVGEDEADAAKGKINIDSPLAQALLKKRAGDAVSMVIDGEKKTASIESIHYEVDDDTSHHAS